MGIGLHLLHDAVSAGEAVDGDGAKGHLEAAVDLYTHYLELVPRAGDVWALLGRALHQLSAVGADVCLRTALELAPADPSHVHTELGLVVRVCVRACVCACVLCCIVSGVSGCLGAVGFAKLVLSKEHFWRMRRVGCARHLR
jgi:hypothetical protein